MILPRRAADGGMKMKHTALTALMLALALCLGGCFWEDIPRRQEGKNTLLPERLQPAAPDSGGRTFGVMLPREGDEDCQILLEALQQAAGQKGDHLLVCQAGGDLYTQIGQAEALIRQGVDGVYLMAVDGSGLKLALEALSAAKIPVVALDTAITRGQPDAFVGSDDAQVGQVTAGLLRSRFPNGCRAFVLENLEEAALYRRVTAFYAAMNSSGFYFVGAAECADEAEAARQAMSGFLAENPAGVDVVVCAGGQMAAGVIAAYEEAGEYLPLIYCMGTSESAQAALKDGKLAALVEKPTEEAAGKAAQAMEEVLAGRSPGSQTLPPRVLLGGAG